MNADAANAAAGLSTLPDRAAEFRRRIERCVRVNLTVGANIRAANGPGCRFPECRCVGFCEAESAPAGGQEDAQQ